MKKIPERDPNSHDPKNSFSSSSSSDFEFTVAVSPRKSSTALCPADELFCNGHLLPLHHSRRLSAVRTLLSSSSTSSSSDSTAATSRDSTGSRSSSNGASSRPSLATDDDDFNRPMNPSHHPIENQPKKTKHFSFSRFSSVFRIKNHDGGDGRSCVKRIGSTAKEVIKKYLRKVQLRMGRGSPSPPHAAESAMNSGKSEESRFSISFSGNLRYPRRQSSFLPSCPSSTRSSPTHSGVLRRGVKSLSSGSIGGFGSANSGDMSSMEELHSAIQGAIAHCKNSLIQNKNTIEDDTGS